MKKLKVIGLFLFFGGILVQIIYHFFIKTESQNLWITPFFWGAIATCLGALLLTIYRLKRLIEEMRLSKECCAPKDLKPDGMSEIPPKISEEDKLIQQFHCQLTTPGLWPLE